MERSFYKSIARAVVILFSLALLFTLVYQTPEKTVQSINLTELSQKIKSGEVAKVEVSGDKLDITLADGNKLVSQKESGVGITETLGNLGLAPEDLARVEIGAKDESGAAFWMNVLIPTLLPIIIFFFFFWFIF